VEKTLESVAIKTKTRPTETLAQIKPQGHRKATGALVNFVERMERLCPPVRSIKFTISTAHQEKQHGKE
jgi:hypothetical protein